MDNQHKKIKGYRDLSQKEIDAMNEIKQLAATVEELIEKLEGTDSIDKRWLAIAKTDLQKGFMSAVRSVAKPDSF
ncbi:Phage protein [Yersinia phage fHe-Yen9-04]|uniref:Phage protein n=2 Tax=Eneladusvirus Yen904 TaxID=2560849 RepID=A0A2C9CY14_9CAUD|nr:Phage protein [Yersinia phage fHe-Yen9-04]SOK58725.1 Phage protein [Yersinia phage fHe-Yen9-04]SOK59260.1 Phage protein [Yersinia phage fHe-Yen9-03]VUE36494.1 Phage protein [Yersinia phage fHe-Yen9-04]